MKRITIITIILLLSACSKHKADGVKATDKKNLELVASEAIIPATPEGFKEGFRAKNKDTNVYVIEYIPTAETVDKWSEIITIQYFPLTSVDPEKFYYDMVGVIHKYCEGFSSDKAIVRSSDGYKNVRGMSHCGKGGRSGEGEVTAYSIMNGVTGIHVLQRAIRTKPFTENGYKLNPVIAEKWSTFFDKSKLCTQFKSGEKCYPM